MSPPVEVSHKNVSKKEFYYSFALICSLFYLWGFSYGLLDVLNKHFQVFFNITKLQSTGLQVLYFGAYLLFSPVAGIFMNKFGYKKGIYLGLGLFSTGALMFWPSAHFEKFGGFLGATWIIGCGLCTLEVAANSYVAVLGDPKHASFRLNFAQSWNGLASFAGPLIASKYFFSDGNDKSLATVQYIYLAVAGFGGIIALLFFFATLPEISDNVLEDELTASGLESKSFFSNTHVLFGFATQTFYVGAQVCMASFALNYFTDVIGDVAPQYTTAEASRLFAFMQITFMIARFVSTPIVRIFDPAKALIFYGAMCTIFAFVAAGTTNSSVGLASFFIVFFFESIIYPTIFCLSTQNTGRWTKRSGGLMVSGVGGAAWMPPLQGLMADKLNSRISYIIPALGFAAVPAFGLYMIFHNARTAEELSRVNNVIVEYDDEKKA